MDCIFCKIINKDISANISYEDQEYIAFDDIRPKFNTHILILPKKHIEVFHWVTQPQDKDIVKWMFDVAWELIDKKNLSGCNLVLNSWSDYWQEIFHIHLHLMSND